MSDSVDDAEDFANASLQATPHDFRLKFQPVISYSGDNQLINETYVDMDGSSRVSLTSEYMDKDLSIMVYIPRLDHTYKCLVRLHSSKRGDVYKMTIMFDPHELTSTTVRTLWMPWDWANRKESPMVSILLKEIRIVKVSTSELTLFLSNKQKIMDRLLLLPSDNVDFVHFSRFILRSCFRPERELFVSDPKLYLPGYSWATNESGKDNFVVYVFNDLRGHSFWSQDYDHCIMGQSYFYDSLYKDIKQEFRASMILLAHELLDELSWRMDQRIFDANVYYKFSKFYDVWKKLNDYYPVDCVNSWNESHIAINFAFQMVFLSNLNSWGQVVLFDVHKDKLVINYKSPHGRKDKFDIIPDSISYYEVMSNGGCHSIKICFVTVQRYVILRSPSAEQHYDFVQKLQELLLESSNGSVIRVNLESEDMSKLIKPATKVELANLCQMAFDDEQEDWPMYGTVARRLAHRDTAGHAICFDSVRCASCSVAKACKSFTRTVVNKLAVKLVCTIGELPWHEIPLFLECDQFKIPFKVYMHYRDVLLEWFGQEAQFLQSSSQSESTRCDSWQYGLYDYSFN